MLIFIIITLNENQVHKSHTEISTPPRSCIFWGLNVTGTNNYVIKCRACKQMA